MYKILPKTTDKSGKDLLIYNLKKASEMKNVMLVSCIIEGFLKSNEGDYYDVQSIIIENKINISLKCLEDYDKKIYKIVSPGKTNKELAYICDFVYYEDINEIELDPKLKLCGILVPINCDPKEIFLDYNFNSDEVTSQTDEIIRDLRFNKIELDYIKFDPQKELFSAAAKAKEKYSADPVSVMYGIGPRGDVVNGFFVTVDNEKKLVSEIGMMSRLNEKMENETKFINLSDRGTWVF